MGTSQEASLTATSEQIQSLCQAIQRTHNCIGLRNQQKTANTYDLCSHPIIQRKHKIFKDFTYLLETQADKKSATPLTFPHTPSPHTPPPASSSAASPALCTRSRRHRKWSVALIKQNTCVTEMVCRRALARCRQSRLNHPKWIGHQSKIESSSAECRSGPAPPWCRDHNRLAAK